MIPDVKWLVDAGFSLLPLKPRTKRPIADNWTELPTYSWKAFERVYRDGQNIGVRLGKPSIVDDLYLYVIDLDNRVAEEADDAWAELEDMFPGVKFSRFPTVQSGSRGESRHIYFVSEGRFRSHKLAHSGKKFTDDEGKKHWTWEIELFGTGKQVAIPPSIHPDTGKEYRWLKKPRLEIGFPEIDADTIEDLIAPDDIDRDDDAPPLGLSYADAEDILKDLDLDYWCEDREGWRNVGMALHHEFEGSREGYEIWVAFSKQSRKFDSRVQKEQWRSFGKHRGRPFRMASLMEATKETRIGRDFDDLPDEDDEDEVEDTETTSGAPSKRRKGDPDLSILRESPLVAPPFPTSILGKFWEERVKEIAHSASAPPDYVAAALFAVAGGLIGNTHWSSPYDGWKEPPVVWGQVIGSPSTNKSPAFSPFMAAMEEIERRWAQPFAARHRQWVSEKTKADKKRKVWEAILAAKIEKGEDDFEEMPADCVAPPEPEKRRIVVNDVTIEKLVRIHAGNERGILNFRDEMTSWFTNLGRYNGGNDRPIWLESYGGRPYGLDRVKDGGIAIHVPRFSVSILGGIQPEPLIAVLESPEDGLQARFMPFWPEEEFRPTKLGVTISPRFTEALMNLADLTMDEDDDGFAKPHVVMFAKKARDHFIEWKDTRGENERYEHHKLKGAFGKANGHVVRLALILEMLWWAEDGFDDPPEEISLKAVKAAIRFREEYLVPMQLRVHGHGLATDEGRLAKTIATWIIKHQPDQVNVRDLRRTSGIKGVSSRTATESVEDALTYLAELGWLRIEQVSAGKKGGRPRTLFVVNERLWDLI